MQYLKKIIPPICFLLLVVILLQASSVILRPDRTSYGAVWDLFLAEPEDSLDYIYLGSSYAYCDINPSLIYETTNLTGYVMAGPEQTMSITYYYLKEILKTQSPQAVIIEASSLHFNEYQDYTQINVGYMPFSFNRLGAIAEGAEPDLRTGLLFDVYFYHELWTQVRLDDIIDAITPAYPDYNKGYTPVDGAYEYMEGAPFLRESKSDEVYEENLSYLYKIIDLCLEEGIEPVMVFHPTYSQLSQETYEVIREDILTAYPQITYCNWSNDMEEIGLVAEEHYYDPGHLNTVGATIFSPWVGEFFTSQLHLVSSEQEEETTTQWQESVAYWKAYLEE